MDAEHHRAGNGYPNPSARQNSEEVVSLRGEVKVTTHNDEGSIIEDVVLSQESGNYGVDIPKNVWHKLDALEAGGVIFECEERAVVPHEEEGVLRLQP